MESSSNCQESSATSIFNAKSNVKRSKNYEAWQRNEQDVNTLNTSHVALHHRKRRILNSVFTETSVRAAGLFINKHGGRWSELLPDGDSKIGLNLRTLQIGVTVWFLTF